MDNVKRIVVLDDDPDIGIMIKMMLEFKGYEVTVIDRAEKIKDTIREVRPSMVIMDMLLSGRNGMDVCQELKNESSTATVPVMMMSAHPNAKDTCLKAGANAFIAKPFDMQELLGKVTDLIEADTVQGRQ